MRGVIHREYFFLKNDVFFLRTKVLGRGAGKMSQYQIEKGQRQNWDFQLKEGIEANIRCTFAFASCNIIVNVDAGIVTLSGTVESLRKKEYIKNFVAAIEGVKAILMELQLHLSGSLEQSDAQIAKGVLHALQEEGVTFEDSQENAKKWLWNVVLSP